MATNLTVMLEDKPGTLADIGEAVGSAGVNLAGACAVVGDARGTVHLLVEGDASAARSAIEEAGHEVHEERDVLVVDVQDAPGELGRVARTVADAGVNIELMYLASNTRIVLGVDNEGAAREALGMG